MDDGDLHEHEEDPDDIESWKEERRQYKNPWAENHRWHCNCDRDYKDTEPDYPIGDDELDPEHDISEDDEKVNDIYHDSYLDYGDSEDGVPAVEKEEVEQKPMCFNDVMQKFPGKGGGKAGVFQPPPQYDLGSESEESDSGFVIEGNRVWCKGRMMRLRFPTWLRCQECKCKVNTVDLVDGEEVVGVGLKVLEWIVQVSERIHRMWKARYGE
ncbi:hypothetical protein DFP73DRAFT_601496 [Morchella snyderi]|nr:hypothetical protein DFP73DRAFT_601496 [Morchella snyderi]